MSAQKPSAEIFLSTVKKSGLVEPDRLQKALSDYEASGGNADDGLATAEFLIDRNILSKWQAEKLLLGKHKGYFLGKYRLISLLGKGGMSSVFLAEHILMRRRCAIKVLPTKRVADSSYLARFHREAQAVAALDHPNIVRAYDVDHQVERDAEIHFLVMEYVEGSSLQELVARDGPLGFEDAVDFTRQSALGLEHAHQAGMVHRDIKPGNLLVDPNGTVKLLDLGLARYFSSEDQQGTALTIAHDEKVLGTADYLAPEQALDSHTVDHRADLYSLGCTLYFMLTGHPPFTEGTLAQRLMAHQTKEPPSVETDRPDTPKELSAILRKLMAKKAEDRYATAQEVAGVTLAWLADHASTAWKQAHPLLFGGLRGSDTKLAQETAVEPAKVIPVAKPVVLMMTAPQEEPKTAIVARAPWPTGDLAAAESEPELSAFLAQMDVEPPSQESLPKTDSSPKQKASKPKPPPAPAEKPPATSPAAPVPNFDFLSVGTVEAPPRVTQPAAPDTTSVASKKLPPVKPPPAKPAPKPAAPKAETPAAPQPVSTPPANESAFPSFDFAVPSAAVPVPVEPAAKLTAAPASTSSPALAAKPPFQLPFPLPPRNVLLGGGAAGVFVIGLLGAYLFGWFDSSPGKRPVPPKAASKKAEIWAKPVITVYGEGADYQSLQDALDDVPRFFRPQQSTPDGKPDLRTIQVAEGTHEESILIDGSKSQTAWPEGIVVRGEGTVIFKPKGDGPVLSIKEAMGLTLENLTFDADQHPVGVQIAGYVTGSRVSKLQILGFTEAGLVLHGVQAFGDQFLVEQLRCDANSSSAVGIRVEPHVVGASGDDPNNITIRGCRMNGPFAAGISVKGALPYKVTVRESVFVKAAVGIRFDGPGRWIDFHVTNNSFFQCPIGIAFTTQPDALTGGLMIRRNLFVGTSTAEALVQAGYNEPAFQAMLSDPGGGMEWNWSDRTAPATLAPGEIKLFAANGKRGDAALALASQNPGDAQFLAPTGPSLHKSIPNPREHEKPWIGAIGP